MTSAGQFTNTPTVATRGGSFRTISQAAAGLIERGLGG